MVNRNKIYNAADYSNKEQEMMKLFNIQHDDAKKFFLEVIKPRLDRSYKLYIAYGGDRQKEIKAWQSNVQIPYIQSAVETMVPRIIDARPEFSVVGRKESDQLKAEKQEKLMEYFWERAEMDVTNEDFVRATLIYGTGFLQVSWKKDIRKLKFLKTTDTSSKKYEWKKEERTFFDGPMCEWVDNYNLWYDWHNTERGSKQYWLKRLVLSEAEITRRYPMADKKRLALALNSDGGDLTDYASIRQETRTVNLFTTKSSAASGANSGGIGGEKYQNASDSKMQMYEVFEWWRPFEDAYAVLVGGSHVPIFKKGFMPIPMDFKEAPFVEATYLKIPGEYEGYGLPLILESPQIMLNLVKNQRLDSATLSIHKMWVVNPLANVNKDELVTRPFGIIYSVDPNGVREIQFSDVKPSAYKEEELLKSDMQYASGVDDFSQGIGGGGSSSATEVRHLRESTLERVRMFVNHLGNAYSEVLRYWMDLTRQLFTKNLSIRITGKNGQVEYPLIEKKDLEGYYDYRAKVLPSIAGQDEVKKKQDMDLYQLLINLPFIDPQKLTTKVLVDWGWSIDGVTKSEETDASSIQPPMGADGNPVITGAPAGAVPTGMPSQGASPALHGAPIPVAPTGVGGGMGGPGFQNLVPAAYLRSVVGYLRKTGEKYDSNGSDYTQFSNPINLLAENGIPPTVTGISKKDKSKHSIIPNIAGHNRAIGGRVDTNIPSVKTTSVQSNILNKAMSIQKKK